MGTSSSSLNELQENQYLHRLAGKEHISHNDPFWNQLLSFTFSPLHMSSEYHILEDNTKSMLDLLLMNNPQSCNLGSLTKVFLVRGSELKVSVQCENKVFIWQTHNALFIIRCILKYFIEALGDDNSILKHFHTKSNENAASDKEFESSENLLELFMNVLVEIIVDVPLADVTYTVIVEAVNTLLVLLSVQMFYPKPNLESLVYKFMMHGKCSIHALLLMKTLIQYYINQEKCPHCLNNSFEGSGLISGLASGLWNVLTLRYSRGSSATNEGQLKTVLSNQSLLLLLTLVNHYTNEDEISNPYRKALFSFRNSVHQEDEQTVDISAFRLDYNRLHAVLCETIRNDQTTLFLYLLLHGNANFKQFVILNDCTDALVIPILKILYSAPERNSHHIYMALIVILILSEDDRFNEKVHSNVIKSVAWYTERTLSEISLGSLMVLVIIRTIQYNMTRMHDKYLHTNCLAALANMSSSFKNLHQYACQKFVTLFENLSKRHTMMVNHLKSGGDYSTRSDVEEELESSDFVQDLSVIEEVERMLLEILNSCLTSQLEHNINLLYTLLYKRHIFSTFRTNVVFQDIIQNIDTVLSYFSEHLEAAEKQYSVAEVLDIVKTASLNWPKDKLKKFPELKFKYVEEGQSEEFFVPYLWSLIYHMSGIYWNSRNILIFNPDRTL